MDNERIEKLIDKFWKEYEKDDSPDMEEIACRLIPALIGKVNELVEENEKLKQQRDIYKEHWIKQLDQMLNEFDKDGWCRLVMKKDEVLKMKKEMENDYGIFD